MCLYPRTIKNPNKGIHTFYTEYTKDTDCSYIRIPCGVCPECRGLYQTYLLQRCQLMSTDHDIYFATLTYSNEAMPYTHKVEHIDGNCRRYRYADPRDFRLMIKRIRKNYLRGNPEFKYLAVTEYGGRTHRPHWHILFFVPQKNFQYYDIQRDKWCDYDCSDNSVAAVSSRTLNFQSSFAALLVREWRRNLSKSTKKPDWLNLSQFIIGRDGRSTFDFHYVRPIVGKNTSHVCKYVTKYVLKFDKWFQRLSHALYNNLRPDDYAEIYKVIRPRILMSLHFGDSVKYRPIVRKGIDIALNTEQTKHRPVFFDLETGRTMPLARYLRHKFITADEQVQLVALEKMLKGGTPWDDNVCYDDSLKRSRIYINEDRYRKILDYLDQCNNADVEFNYDDDDIAIIPIYGKNPLSPG